MKKELIKAEANNRCPHCKKELFVVNVFDFRLFKTREQFEGEIKKWEENHMTKQ